MRRSALHGLAVLALLATATAGAEEPEPPAGRVHLAAEVERSVPNDRAVVALELTDEGEDPVGLADRVSRRVSAALARARREPEVEVSSGGIQTRPVFHEGELRRWRATQRIILETRRLDALGALLAELQSHVPLVSVHFDLSSGTRRAVEEELIDEALAAFQARAEKVGRALGARRVHVHEISVDTGANRGPTPVRRMHALQAEVAPPPLAAGRSQVRVAVRGQVQLELP